MFSFTRWFTGGLLGDKRGIQSPYPMGATVPNLKNVGPNEALQISTVWACVDLITKTLASMPMQIFELKKNKREISRDSNLWTLLHDSPNALMTPFEFYRALLLDLILRGNGYAVVDRNSSGEVVAMFPISADQVTVQTVEKSENQIEIVYQYELNGVPYRFAPERILHLKGMGKGLIGLSNLEFMRPNLDESIKMQENSALLFGNGSSAKGILTVDHNLDDTARKKLAKKYSGIQLYNESGLWILPADMRYQQVSLSPADTELLESRRFSVEEICRWFGVPEVLINGSSDKVEEAMDLFYKTTIRPLAINIEQAVRKSIFTSAQREKYTCEFNLDAMLRASLSNRAEVYAKMVQNGLKTRNECRELENDAPLDGGDGLTVQNNLVPINQLGKIDPSQTSQKEIPEEIRQ
ncbi:phage portal protein [uncultured Parasutterella sp.]|uniref:phage portal protein n=3 Tax=uncultured Parasutterella sp. TaxID=1263098 RepID=UPI00261E97EB|nr:phage portal protein [uncultured Parasutterella sp.]